MEPPFRDDRLKKVHTTQQPEFGRLLFTTRRRLESPLSTREGLAERLGISSRLLTQIEKGEKSPPEKVVEWLETILQSPLPPQRGSREGILSDILKGFQFPESAEILDIPCGPGRLTWELRKLGYRVTAADLVPECFEAGEPPAVHADMNHPLPFPDESFDLILSAEGVEHLENPWLAFREFSRILKTSGTLVITTPNYSNIERRVAYLLKGSAARPSERMDSSGQESPHLSTFPTCFWKMAGERAGLQLISLDSFSPRPKQWFYWPLACLVHLLSRLATRKSRERYSMDWTQGMNALLGGRSLVMVFKKAP